MNIFTSSGLLARTFLLSPSDKPGPDGETRPTPYLPAPPKRARKPDTACFEVVYAGELGVRT